MKTKRIRRIQTTMNIVEKAVEVTRNLVKPQQNPYNYLFHYPNRIFTLQWFSHWTQNYQNHLMYLLMENICKITNHIAIPQILLNKHTNLEKYKGKKVRISKNVFYILKEDEIPDKLKQKYNRYKSLLEQEINGKLPE